MSDQIDLRPHRFLTEQEAATILRRSQSAIKRLRLSGELPYIPGRPVRIERSDIEAWVAAQKAKAAAAAEKAKHDARPFSELTPAEQDANARAWAIRMKMKPVRRRG